MPHRWRSLGPSSDRKSSAVDRGYINPADLCRLHDRCQAFATAGLTCRLADLLPPNLCRDSFDSHVCVAME